MARPKSRGGTRAGRRWLTAEHDDFAEYQRAYRGFVKGVVIFAAHVLAVLMILSWVVSGSFG